MGASGIGERNERGDRLRVGTAVGSPLSRCWDVAAECCPFGNKSAVCVHGDEQKGCILYLGVYENTPCSCSDYFQSYFVSTTVSPLNWICRGTHTDHSKYTVSEAKKQILDLGVTRWRNKKPNRFYIEKPKRNSDKLRSDHKGRHRKWSQISKNDIEDKQNVSKAENHKKQNLLILTHMKEIFEINLKNRFEKNLRRRWQPVVSVNLWKKPIN